ncbi:MAG TPA: 1,4-dihydroxy-2-naphthoate polyprenyltransferase [Segeticoccus sp.]|jgi:1,4-dihydroxy-2-naphthoate octaprenyltransferase|nr:1,4-dihydroxy-2-naphthoate polyprenyltransferase [Segeticoccus sp.]
MATFHQWVEGARPRTLPAAIAPVIVGTGSSYAIGTANLGYGVLALLVAVGLQIGVNYANDYSDGVRGTDRNRVGPARLVGGKLATPGNVKLAAFGCFGFAALCGLALIAMSEAWFMLLVGAAAIWAAWHYTGGSRPYGYSGWGEVFVFIFFGLVATLATTWTQSHALDWASLAGAVGVGAVSCALLVANNLRDIDGDAASGKRTLAVRLGDARSRQLYAALLVVALLAVIGSALVHWTAVFGIMALPFAWVPYRLVRGGATGMRLVPVLAATGQFLLGYGFLLGIGLYLASRF